MRAQLANDASAGAVPAWQYTAALAVQRPRLQGSFADFFRRYDVEALLYPTCHLPAKELGPDFTVELNGKRYPTYATFTRNTAPSSNAGIPALSFASGLVNGLPVGIEVAGPQHSDERLLEIGRALHEALPGVPPPPSL